MQTTARSTSDFPRGTSGVAIRAPIRPIYRAFRPLRTDLSRVHQRPSRPAGIYRQTLARTARIHLTEIDIEPEGDTFLPDLDPAEWRETERVEGPADSPSGLRFRFITLDRV